MYCSHITDLRVINPQSIQVKITDSHWQSAQPEGMVIAIIRLFHWLYFSDHQQETLYTKKSRTQIECRLNSEGVFLQMLSKQCTMNDFAHLLTPTVLIIWHSMIWYVTVWYNTVQWSTVEYWCSAVQCSTVQYSAVQYSTVQCSTVQCSAVQYSAVQYSAV